jgi:hypothetical protein
MSSGSRRACSIAAQDDGFTVRDQDRIVLDTVGSYRSALRQFARVNNLEVWYSHVEIEPVLQQFAGQFKPKQVKQVEKRLAKARTRDSM